MPPVDWSAYVPSDAELRATLAAGRGATLLRSAWRHRAAGRSALEARDYAGAEHSYAEELRHLRALAGLRAGYSHDDAHAALACDHGGRFWAMVDACRSLGEAADHARHLRAAVDAWHEESRLLSALAGLPESPSNDDLRVALDGALFTAVMDLAVAHGRVGTDAGHLHEFDRAADGLERALQLEAVLAGLPDVFQDSDFAAELVSPRLPVFVALTMLYTHVCFAGGRSQSDSRRRAALRMGIAVLPLSDGPAPWNARRGCLEALYELLNCDTDADERARVAAQLEQQGDI